MSKERDDIKETIFKNGAVLQLSMNRHEQEIVGNFPELGLCNRCSNINGVVTEFGCRQATCHRNMAPLTGKHRIRECTSFWDKSYVGIQSLIDMNPVMIDVKKDMGF